MNAATVNTSPRIPGTTGIPLGLKRDLRSRRLRLALAAAPLRRRQGHQFRWGQARRFQPARALLHHEFHRVGIDVCNLRSPRNLQRFDSVCSPVRPHRGLIHPAKSAVNGKLGDQRRNHVTMQKHIPILGIGISLLPIPGKNLLKFCIATTVGLAIVDLAIVDLAVVIWQSLSGSS